MHVSLLQHIKRKQRVRVIEWWVEVGRECFNIGNFNSLMGIIAGLNMSTVSRLKKTVSCADVCALCSYWRHWWNGSYGLGCAGVCILLPVVSQCNFWCVVQLVSAVG